MVNCSVVGCAMNRSSNFLPWEISFHKIPSASDKNKQLRALTNIRCDNSLPKDSFCSQHLKPSCFQSSKLIIFTLILILRPHISYNFEITLSSQISHTGHTTFLSQSNYKTNFLSLLRLYYGFLTQKYI